VICTEKPQKSHQNQIPGARTWELRNVKQRVKLLATAVGAATFHCWVYKFLGKFLSYNFPKYYRLDSYKEVSLIFLHSLSEVLQMQMLSSSEWVPKRILKIAGLLVFCQLLAKKSIFIFNYLNISFMYVHSLCDRYFFSIHNAITPHSKLKQHITGLQINLYLEQPMEIQLFATFFQRRK
jgi:hypothetical protein